jgi:hypothetical protein
MKKINQYKIGKAFNILLLIVLAMNLPILTKAQTVKNPVSEITTNIKHYTFTYLISSTQKKDIEYILVKASNGDVKSCFNACDVCYAQHKGYSQNGTELRCNNCGNRFQIDGLGTQGSGGCNPGYLPHSIIGDSVVINNNDLIKGAYYFLAQSITGIDEENDKDNFYLVYNSNELTIKMNNSDYFKINIYDLNSNLIKTISGYTSEILIDTKNFSAGIYIISLEQSGKVRSKLFNLTK